MTGCGKKRMTEACARMRVEGFRSKDEPKRRQKRINAYYCRLCDAWHIGHANMAWSKK